MFIIYFVKHGRLTCLIYPEAFLFLTIKLLIHTILIYEVSQKKYGEYIDSTLPVILVVNRAQLKLILNYMYEN